MSPGFLAGAFSRFMGDFLGCFGKSAAGEWFFVRSVW
jgi:hypothetical protein